METLGHLLKKIEKMAEFQMRKATHIRFLENCMEENVVPKGLMLEKKIMVGERSNLQEIVDRALLKFSMEIMRLVNEEHYRQLHNSKGDMLQIEADLKRELNDEAKFNEISGEIFSKIEHTKNAIVEKQQKKLANLIDKRDGCSTRFSKHNKKSQKNKKEIHTAPSIRQNKSKDTVGNMMSAKVAKGKKIHPTKTPSQPKQRLNATLHDIDNRNGYKKNSCQAKSPMDSSVKSLKQPKNGQSPGVIKNVSTCAKASKTGITKNTKKTKEEVLDTTIQALITCLKDLKKTDASLGLQRGRSGNNRRKSRKKWNVEKKQY